MPAMQILPDFYEQLLSGVHNFRTHVFKAVLTNTAPSAASKVLADIAQVGGGAYTAGGYVLDGVTLSRTGAVAKVAISDENIAASGGSIGPFRYAVVVNDTANGKPLVGYIDRGESITLGDGDNVVLDFDPDKGVVTMEAKSVA